MRKLTNSVCVFILNRNLISRENMLFKEITYEHAVNRQKEIKKSCEKLNM